MRLLVALLAAILPIGGTAAAHEFTLGSLTIEHPWARPAASGNGAAYLVIENLGPADRLVGVATDIAATADLHATTIDAQGVGRMAAVQAVEIPQGAQAKLTPGGLHIMLMGLKAPLKEGEKFPLTLTFEHAGQVRVEVEVEKKPSHAADGGMEGTHMHGQTTN